jgi:hypothetical protein
MVNKLFVWECVYSDYTDGIAFALAETVEEARKLIVGEEWYNECIKWNKNDDIFSDSYTVHEVTEKVGYMRHGGG